LAEVAVVTATDIMDIMDTMARASYNFRFLYRVTVRERER